MFKSQKRQKTNPAQQPASVPEKKVNLPISLEEQIVKKSNQVFVEDNKREQNSQRLSKRQLVGNRQINPFIKTDNYIHDISVQDTFLRPQNSNFNVKNKDLNDI